MVFNPENIVWTGSGYCYEASIMNGLVILMIDVYTPHPEKGNAYQIRIKGCRIEKVGTKLFLPDLDAAKARAVHALNELAWPNAVS